MFVLINLRNFLFYRVYKDPNVVVRIVYLLQGLWGGVLLGTIVGLIVNLVSCVLHR
jgi:hypothetical protein